MTFSHQAVFLLSRLGGWRLFPSLAFFHSSFSKVQLNPLLWNSLELHFFFLSPRFWFSSTESVHLSNSPHPEISNPIETVCPVICRTTCCSMFKRFFQQVSSIQVSFPLLSLRNGRRGRPAGQFFNKIALSLAKFIECDIFIHKWYDCIEIVCTNIWHFYIWCWKWLPLTKLSPFRGFQDSW